MNLNPGRTFILLRRGGLLRIRGRKGKSLTVVRGKVWITQEGDVRDVVVGEFETITLQSSGLVIAHALDANAVLVVEDGVLVEHVGQAPSGVQRVPDVSYGSRLYVRTRALRAHALNALASNIAHRLRCAGQNLLHRSGFAVQPC